MSSPSSTTRISGTSTTLARLPNPPTFVECKDLRFLIMDAPSDRNLDLYMQEMERYHVTDVVRACEPTYDRGVLEKKGIEVHVSVLLFIYFYSEWYLLTCLLFIF